MLTAQIAWKSCSGQANPLAHPSLYLSLADHVGIRTCTSSRIPLDQYIPLWIHGEAEIEWIIKELKKKKFIQRDKTTKEYHI